MNAVWDVAAVVCLVLGSLLCLLGSIGLLRFPDLLSRLHAATKPQVLGTMLVLVAVALSLRSSLVIGMLVLTWLFQMATAPVSSHMVSRAALRTGQINEEELRRGNPRTPVRRDS